MYKFFPPAVAVLFAGLAGLFSLPAQANYILEKVVEVSRHGVRPPSPDNRRAIENGSARRWPAWQAEDGNLTGHGYTAAWLKGRYESDYYRQAGLLTKGCPGKQDFYLVASPLQRTRATAQALAEAAFPGCGITAHSKATYDPLFQLPADKVSKAQAARHYQEALRAMGGSLSAAQRRLEPSINALKEAVCDPAQPCPAFSQPWQLAVWSNGTVGIQGLDTLAAMAETLRLEWSENKPLDEIAFGKVRKQAELAALLPLLSAKYDYTNDLPGLARQGASRLMSQIAGALRAGTEGSSAEHAVDAPPDVRWLLYVAHDINIAWLRTMLDFNWQQADYPHGNIPPGSSLVFERWRDKDEHFIRIYFQAQSLDQLRELTPLDGQHPPLLTELTFPGCRKTPVGTLCPWHSAMQRIERHIMLSSTASAR
ncbi:histidine-type phosphatase [Erwinia sp.]|uniref:histidine-type phosphatase n=1 Tax=Erwinia citreus TaxID=558 RepID=UPI0028989D67|nr:histidine-type phosphatase [Erwinia sp.]